jgi:hypothetical protein
MRFFDSEFALQVKSLQREIRMNDIVRSPSETAWRKSSWRKNMYTGRFIYN